MRYGLKTVVSYARKFGLTHNVPAVPSIGIGACEATLIEMTAAYTAFPNGGFRNQPFFVHHISDKNGRTEFQSTPATHEVLRRQTAWILTTMLQDVNIRGTAARVWASGFNHPSGGKTGTTNNYTDAWYVGFTKRYTAGVWVGSDDHKPMGPGHTGTDDALPIWLDIMRSAHRGLKREDFPRPEGIVRAAACPKTGLAAQSFCSGASEDFYLAGTEPSEPCSQSHHMRIRRSDAGDVFNSNRQGAGDATSGDKVPAGRVRHTF